MEPKTAAHLCLSAAKVEELTRMLLHDGRLGSPGLWSKRQAASLRRLLLRSGHFRLSAGPTPPHVRLTCF